VASLQCAPGRRRRSSLHFVTGAAAISGLQTNSYRAVQPPSANTELPVTNDEASEARNTATHATRRYGIIGPMVGGALPYAKFEARLKELSARQGE
jgi:hypothetical protein